jgi:thiol peroxidase
MTQHIYFGESLYKLTGKMLQEGMIIPDFELTQFVDKRPSEFTKVQLLSSRRPTIFCCMHSVDGKIGARQARRMERLLTGFRGEVNALLVSSDLPFVLNRFAAFESIEHLVVASDFLGHFGRAMGIHVEDIALLARAIIVVNAEGLVSHVDVVSEFTDEPDYDAAIEILSESFCFYDDASEIKDSH